MSKLNRGNNDKPKLCRFGYVDYIVLASSLAIAVAEEVDTTDLNILAGFFATFSDELALIASVKGGCAPPEPDSGSGSNPDSGNENDDVHFIPPLPAHGSSRPEVSEVRLTSTDRARPKHKVKKKKKKIKKYKKKKKF